MKLTKPEHIEALQLIAGVVRTVARSARAGMAQVEKHRQL